ncbi:DUF1796 family putative cysteine peptidase [Sodalis glossinidius]|uniref:DUF1796 family putative cysteine peptidase n=1 Tax=Sodalis glossinidius TaxID=63612 RepID=UPI0013051FB5|nr:DUF1796 family putative cysteine peptidase [Sodalis glossinidius]
MKFNADNNDSESLSRSSEQLPKICNSPTCDSVNIKEEQKIVNPLISLVRGERLINGRKVKHIASLGNHCLYSATLKDHGLKKYSLPFDCIFTHSEIILNCLNDDFSLFLDKKHYLSLTNERHDRDYEPGASHVYFENKHSTINTFNHRDVTQSENYNYIVRTVERFRKLLTSDDGKIFMMIALPKYDLSNSFDKLRNRLNELTNNFHFIAIQLQDPTYKHNSLSIEKILDKKMLSYTISHHLPLKRVEADLDHELMKLL